MAYFSNGTEGLAFEERECSNCIHEAQDNGCPILALHHLYNYDQIVDGERDNPLASALKILVDDDNALGSMCQMRIANRWPGT